MTKKYFLVSIELGMYQHPAQKMTVAISEDFVTLLVRCKSDNDFSYVYLNGKWEISEEEYFLLRPFNRTGIVSDKDNPTFCPPEGKFRVYARAKDGKSYEQVGVDHDSLEDAKALIKDYHYPLKDIEYEIVINNYMGEIVFRSSVA